MVIFAFIYEKLKGKFFCVRTKLILRNITIDYLILSDNNFYNRSSMNVETLQLKPIFVAMRFIRDENLETTSLESFSLIFT